MHLCTLSYLFNFIHENTKYNNILATYSKFSLKFLFFQNFIKFLLNFDLQSQNYIQNNQFLLLMTQFLQSKQSKTTPQTQNSQLLSNSKAQSLNESRANSSTAYYDLKNKLSVKPIIYTLFKVLGFICNFNYSIENALITMMMITFLTPNLVDSLIWIIPNVISVFIRPYLIRYVHKTHRAHRIRSQAFLINVLLVLVAVGSFLIGQSGLMNDSKKGFHVLRIFVCSIGWTLTGMSLELVEYFADKLKESFENQCYVKSSSGSSKADEEQVGQEFGIISFEEEESKQTLRTNYKFLGSLLGYLLVLILFMFPLKNIKKLPSFFTHASLIYNINGFITLFAAIAFYGMIAYSGLPKPDPELKPKPVSYRLSYSLNYYLPGFSQLKSISIRGLAFLAIHFMMVFVMDVMFIYTTMWTTGSVQAQNMKTAEANFYGINWGVFYLIFFTFVYYGNFLDFLNQNNNTFGWRALLLGSSTLFIVCFWFLKSLFYLPLIVTLALSVKTYQNSIEPLLEQIEPQIKVCKQVVIRIQKVAVLNALPFISMILLDRDDIQDCMIWCSFLLTAITVLYTMFVKETPQTQAKQDQTVQKTKHQ